MDTWDNAHPAWAYEDVRKFERAFRRAELQLTGEKHGLEWFYEPASRLNRQELECRAAAGDRSVARQLSRIADDERRFWEWSQDLPMYPGEHELRFEDAMESGMIGDRSDQYESWGSALIRAYRLSVTGVVDPTAHTHSTEIATGQRRPGDPVINAEESHA